MNRVLCFALLAGCADPSLKDPQKPSAPVLRRLPYVVSVKAVKAESQPESCIIHVLD